MPFMGRKPASGIVTEILLPASEQAICTVGRDAGKRLQCKARPDARKTNEALVSVDKIITQLNGSDRRPGILFVKSRL
jgi:hypothetical protein